MNGSCQKACHKSRRQIKMTANGQVLLQVGHFTMSRLNCYR